ncbi:amino acid permease [Phycisphaerales bacterium]|nr:amino acid permease [Phycisphaerales bacterium]RPG17292.1 MAG: amino acid permease [Phycisphaera sp. TMED9]
MQSTEKSEVPTPTGGDFPKQRRLIGLWSATGICVASMIGSGIFAVTGIVGAGLVSTSNLMMAWIIAGVIALAGALTIGELGAMRPKAGAQYAAVFETLGPVWGYLNGMITLFIGYIAAMAAIALVAGDYIEDLAPWTEVRTTATVLLCGLGFIHAITVVGGKRFNDGLVILKVLLVVGFIIAGFIATIEPILPSAELIEAAKMLRPGSAIATIPPDATPAATLEHLRNAPAPNAISGVIGLAVISISFAYLGWSTAAEVGGEIRRPGLFLPLSIIGSVIVVGGMYLLMNLVYLRVVPAAGMLELNSDGTIQPMASIGATAAMSIFGEFGGRLVTGVIVMLFISTLSVSVMTSGRVVAALSWKGDFPASWGRLNPRGAPTLAIFLMIAATLPLVWYSGITALFEYVGVLTTFAVCMTMISVMVLRVRFPDEPRPFKIPLYPLPPLISLGLGIWLIVTAAIEDWVPVAASAITLALMLLVRPLLKSRSSETELPPRSAG